MTQPQQGRAPLQPREPMGAEFWAPEHKDRDAIAGRLTNISQGTYGPVLELQPVVIVGKGAGRYHSMKLKQNSWLAKLVAPADVGKFLLVVFRGGVPTPKGGSPMRTYDVYELDRDHMLEFAQTVTSGKTPELPAPTYRDPREAQRAADDDDLPF